VPDDMLTAIKPGDFDSRFPELVEELILTQRQQDLYLMPLPGSKHLLAKATMILKRAFPSPEKMSRMYPSSSDSKLIYFYYLVRIKDLILRYCSQVCQMFWGNESVRVLAKQGDEIFHLKDWLMSP
jgi:hypothetical protein